ncbi:hypothetical protein ACN079_18430 [Pseudomonas sp. ABY48]|uniref:hypothetical protein n=1 Tax=Pseudomonas sp. ABY48 TaxID=3402865 RepID=UPI003B4361FB
MKMAAILVLTWIGFTSAGAFASDRNQDYREANRRHWEQQRGKFKPEHWQPAKIHAARTQ